MASTNQIVFRENSVDVSGRKLGQQLIAATEHAVSTEDQEAILNGVLLAGAAECGIADCGSPKQSLAQSLTDRLARRLVRSPGSNGCDLASLARQVADGLPSSVRVSPPEGFAYYALHPLDFAEAAAAFHGEQQVAVVGIRTIGTILSAMVLAGLHRQGIETSRTTMRPVGHPYDRGTCFAPEQLAWIQQHKRRGSAFVVVDEGPGLSGSSFLSVGDALKECGVAGDRITLTGTRDVDPDQLCARDAAIRWKQFRYQRAQSLIWRRFKDLTMLGAGAWRRHLLNPAGEWPSSWTQMERIKFFSPDRRYILKFDGLGAYGEAARERAKRIYEAGFGSQVEDADDGMTAYEFIPGVPSSRSDRSLEMLDRMAAYCAVRLSEFRVDGADGRCLEEMARHNFEQEFGRELALRNGWLGTGCAVLADARMQPHEWVRSREGKILKVDACSHGDDHFQPGPTDIAWDLAGVIVEWDLDRDSESYFVQRYWERTGDDPRPRLPHFTLAYGIYRMAYLKMAVNATHDEAERDRLQHSYRFYRSTVNALCRSTEARLSPH